MPATPAATATPKQKGGAFTPTAAPNTPVQPGQTTTGEDNTVRLHITPFNPSLLKVYLPPSVLPYAGNISYHAVETYPEKGFGYVELPAMEATKLKKKLNGSTLKGSKVRIEDAKPEKRKAGDDAVVKAEEAERSAKRAKKDKKKRKKEDGLLEGVELPDERKVKRGWTEVPVKGNKERKEKKDKKEEKKERKKSKYTKEPELLFKAKLTPVAATEVARKERKDKKKDKKKNRSKQEVVVHEFEKNSKTPSFLKATAVSTDDNAAVDYVNGKGWVDEEGNVVEAETVKAKNKRVLELVEPGLEKPSSRSRKKASATPSPKSSPAPKSTKQEKKQTNEATPPPGSSSSDAESEDSSVVSSSSDFDSDSAASAGASENASPAPAPTTAKAKSNTPEIAITPSSPVKKETHPLEALFKKPKPAPLLPLSNPTSTPAKNLAPINTSFSFFGDGDVDVDMEDGEQDVAVPFTPQTQRDIEWRGLRSAAPTPDTAAIGRRFSFPWRNGSQEADDDDDADLDPEASTQLSNNTKANASSSQLADVAEEDEDEAEGGGEALAGVENEGVSGIEEDGEKEESDFRKWFWENQGNLNRAWKRRRKDAVKTKRSVENRRAIGGARRER
ncbi:uncharacterized protein N0V89_008460 [Didymosphaeria variabile]|uniref:RRM domain-containing protein n=1 Tax=Didymosphaeria variabile TaxID=1932322 RepID=A0A9W8XFS6_9PLEO|nr:uncharacterized protein N0V89_008460 [Didymosphaeria variabile]KAJ4349841.1 hypothetical protein N0V89_008460 [Didymosphaeria variabile]